MEMSTQIDESSLQISPPLANFNSYQLPQLSISAFLRKSGWQSVDFERPGRFWDSAKDY